MSNYITDIQVSGVTYTLSGQSSGATVSEVTQAQYDALVSGGTVDPTVLYIITDAQAGDLTQYWTSAQTQSAITQATSGKVNTSSVVSSVTSASTDSEIPTAKAVWEAASGGSGGSYTAGRGIDITNDEISVSLPISAGTGSGSIVGGYTNNTVAQSYSFVYGKNLTINGTSYSCSVAFGENNKIGGNKGFICGYNNNSDNISFAPHIEGEDNTNNYGSRCSHIEGGHNTIGGVNYAHAEGYYTYANSNFSHTEGYYTKTNNPSEHASGQYNNSVSASTTFGDSGNTLFSVGNGTSNSARHNAFEIRQNGDIYLTSGSTDIKLQDYLGGGEVSSAITSGDTNAVAGGAVYNRFDEVEQVVARALNQLAEANEVVARALNDLNDRITAIENQLNNS